MRRLVANKCPACGRTMRFGPGIDIVEYQGRSRSFSVTGWWCDGDDGCGEAIFSGEALVKSDVVLASLKRNR